MERHTDIPRLPRAGAAALVALLVCAFALAPLFTAAATPEKPVQKWTQIQYPPLPEQEVPKPRRVVLDNGMVVMLLEDHELPLVDAVALIRTGSRLDPAAEAGLGQLAGEVLRTGGTAHRTPEELDQFLDNRAASIETFVSTSVGQANMSSLKADFPEVLEAFADVLRNPVFEADKLEVARTGAIASISRQNDNPQGIAFREFGQIVYGEDSPYARDETYESVGRVTRNDLVAWGETYLHPNRIILGLVGDFDSDQALALVEKAFGDWPRGPEPAASEGDVFYQKQSPDGVFYVEKNDVTQANILMGHLGVRRDNPDYYAIQVMNNVLSGSFASRLFSNVRSAKGLAYTVFGSVGSGWDHPGLFQMYTTTKTGTTGAAIDALIEEAEGMTERPPTAEEVEKAKGSILSSFVFEFDSTREILGQQLRYEYYGYPLDWLERYREGIADVTVDQVREAAAKYIHPDHFAILVVGPSEGMDKPLSTYGEVTDVDITIPEPAEERAEVTEEGKAAAAALIAEAVGAMGGAGVVDGVEALYTTSMATQKTPQGDLELEVHSLRVFPDRYLQEVTLPFGTMSMVVEGDAGFVVGPQGTVDLPASQLENMQRSALRDPLELLKRRHEDGFVATALAPEEVDGETFRRVQVELDGKVTVASLDAEGHVVRMAYRDTGPGGAPGDAVRVFDDFRQVDGLTVPFHVTASFDGDQVLSATVQELEVNPEVDESRFERPE
jgi:predicted Zn-dependent peptidase